MIMWLALALAYLACGVTWARVYFTRWLGDSPRALSGKCGLKVCEQGPLNPEGHHYTRAFLRARGLARFTVVFWPLVLVSTVIVFIATLLVLGFQEIVYAPTKGEKRAQQKQERAALAETARELDLKVPADWSPRGGEDHLGPRARARADELAQQRKHTDARFEVPS